MTRGARGQSLRTRIVAAFLVAFACFLGALGYGLWELGGIGAELQMLDQGYVPLARAATTLESSLFRLELDLDRVGSDEPRPVAGHRSNAQLYHSRIAGGVVAARAAIEGVSEGARSEDERANLDNLDLQLRTIDAWNEELASLTLQYLDHTEAGRSADARALKPELVQARGELETRIKQFSKQVDGRIRGLAEQTSSAQRSALIASGALALVALVSGLAMLGLSVLALNPIGRMTAEVRRIADGDYEVRLEPARDDELGMLARQINEMARAIQQRDEDLRRGAERRLRDKERIARAERLALVGQMLAQITHEVRNPLNAMSLNAELLAEDLGELPPERRDEALEILGTVTSEIRRLEQTTEHYLTLARRPAPELTDSSPTELIHSVARLLEEELAQAGVDLELDLAELDPVELDAPQLRRALLNLVKNAVEAGCERVVISTRVEAGELVLRVRDDGPGLELADATRAFDPFFSTKATGTGLGLAITRQILEDHGGTVALEPSDAGCVFALRIPVGG
jgi:signal transduction histidine kinase